MVVRIGDLTPEQATLGAAWATTHARIERIERGLNDAIAQLNDQYRMQERCGQMLPEELRGYADQLHAIFERATAAKDAVWADYWAAENAYVSGRSGGIRDASTSYA